MRDRLSTKILSNGATRYGVYDETENLLRYEYIKLEDEPTVEGDLFSKANMLPDSIPAALGLKMGNPQVKDALNVLANIGNVHVWQRVQTYADPVPEVPAGYTLGAVETNKNIVINTYGSNAVWYQTASSVAVDGSGNVSLVSPSSAAYFYVKDLSGAQTLWAGKFVLITNLTNDNQYALPKGTIFFVPSDGNLKADSNNSIVYVTKYQSVTGYPYTPAIPAGTYVDYLTSTNPDAYPKQSAEGVQDAYYTLGNVVSGYLFASAWDGNASNYYYSETIKVSDTGTLTQENVKHYTANATNDSWVSNIQSAIRGKFITVSGETNNGGSEGTNLVYIPDDAIVSYFENGVSLGYPYNYGFLVNKMQPVTGHAAIPANTTITYLGQLGGGARIEVGSYVGTGVYGSSNKTSLTFGFEPNLLLIQVKGSRNEYLFLSVIKSGRFVGFYSSSSGSGAGSYTGEITLSSNTVRWYANTALSQMNDKESTYQYTAIG